MHTRPQSFEPSPGIIVRRDASNNIWRVFKDSVERFSTAGTNGDDAQQRAFAFALTLV